MLARFRGTSRSDLNSSQTQYTLATIYERVATPKSLKSAVLLYASSAASGNENAVLGLVHLVRSKEVRPIMRNLHIL